MITDQLFYFATKGVLGVPFPVILLVVGPARLLVPAQLHQAGRQAYFIGSQPQGPAQLSGIRVKPDQSGCCTWPWGW